MAKSGSVEIRTSCDHLAYLSSDLAHIPTPDTPCSRCQHPNENWLCLSCKDVLCSRYVNKHMLQHFQQSNHCLSLGYRDLSVWCNSCNAYLDAQVIMQLRPVYETACILKFDMDTMKEENDAYGDTVSSAPKRMGCRTSSIWSDFEILPKGPDGKERAKCKKCQNSFVADSRDTNSLLRHKAKCHEVDNQIVSRQPLDQAMYREMVALAIIRHNYPFSFAEHENNRLLHYYLNPDVKTISRNTAKLDVIKIYRREKENLKHDLKSIIGRFCLSSDLWSSPNANEYMVLIAHYVDKHWVLQKKVLSFSHVPPSCGGVILAERLLGLLKEWGIEKRVFTITLNNVSYNDTLVSHLKRHPSFGPCLSYGGEFFHVRCGAHILNLIVQDGLKVINGAVYNLRESVKYVRDSDHRKLRFAQCLSELPFLTSKKVRQVPTRWNSTYLMIKTCLKYRDAFSRLSKIDKYFLNCPSEEEWERVEKIVRVLEPFYNITKLFSGTNYPTANLYFHCVWKIQLRITEQLEDDDAIIRAMAKKMKEKFDKYWEYYSPVLSFAVILDPRYKLQCVEFCYGKLYKQEAISMAANLRDKLYDIFEEYKNSTSDICNMVAVTSSSGGVRGHYDRNDDFSGFETFTSQLIRSDSSRSQLDLYLEETLLNHRFHEDLDVMGYWKSHSHCFRELSLMARDILSIPITTVASESAFSIGGRIFDKFRSSLLPQTTEALLCARDWLYGVPAIHDFEEESLVDDFGNLCLSQSSSYVDED
ncbi:zinc finger BED domain-containing protein RICESLEEPER 2 [Quercus suber]|uniref:zinc finger BED domain-containing protein RICESLEEPER 2 n=1 Tax=Quercus suber TaxID=58331 RepID=UPI000CE191B7|nr:zinc finger BED domain-containing protein RICESLEEPER 2-like [Quercus suber]